MKILILILIKIANNKQYYPWPAYLEKKDDTKLNHFDGDRDL